MNGMPMALASSKYSRAAGQAVPGLLGGVAWWLRCPSLPAFVGAVASGILIVGYLVNAML